MTEASQPDQSALERVVEQAISLARARGATAAEAGVGVSTGLSVTVRLGEVETLEYQRDRSLGVTVYAGQRKGSASTANLSPAAVEETVAKALSIASFTADDEYAGLPDATLMASQLPDLDQPVLVNLLVFVQTADGDSTGAQIQHPAGVFFEDFPLRVRIAKIASPRSHHRDHRQMRVFENTHQETRCGRKTVKLQSRVELNSVGPCMLRNLGALN